MVAVAPASVEAQVALWTEPQEPFAIADDLYYVGSAGLASFLFTSDDGHILIDAPLEENVSLIVRNIRRLGFDPSDIRLHLTSHAHFDHVGGLAGLSAVTGGEITIAEPDAGFVSRGVDFGIESEGYPSAAPTSLIGHLDTVRVGGIQLAAHLTPGHTPGCTSWSGEVEIGGRSLSFVIACSLSVLSSYRIVGPDPSYPGQGEDYCRSLTRLESLSPDIFLAAHPEFFGMGAKLARLRTGDPLAFVERDAYRAYVGQARTAIERALAEQGHEGGCAAFGG